MANYFDPEWVATRYAAARPEIHSLVVDHVGRVLSPAKKFSSALDVGCGTGHSTRPLTNLAQRVVGVDPARFMLREAHARGGQYARGTAEALPFRDAAFELVTIGCAYHWCDVDALFAETHRVLPSNGILVIYDNFFYAELPRSSAVMDWLRSSYWSQTGKAPRNPAPDAETFARAGFELLDRGEVETWVPLRRAELITYLTTQSATVAAVESGQRTLAEAEAVLEAGLSPLVPESGSEFRFGGPVWIARSRD